MGFIVSLTATPPSEMGNSHGAKSNAIGWRVDMPAVMGG
jgi:hypothetical protein